MKKIVVILISALMMFALSTFAYADENDCRSISKEERAIVGTGDTDTLIRIYNGTFLHGFAVRDSIDNLKSSEYVLEEIIVSYLKDDYSGITCYRINNSLANKVNGLESAAGVFARYTSESIVDALEKKTKSTIRSIICLCGETSHDGIYIYYKTDNGDFVLYKEYASNEKVYFFPVKDFYAVAKEFYEEKVSTLYGENGEIRKGSGVRLEEVVNIKKYELSLNNTNWLIIIISVIIVLAIVLLSFILIKKARSKRII